MAKPPASDEQLIATFGPRLNYTPPGGWRDESVHPAERLVKTHCCFCGQQCGIQLKVRDNAVIGFEPWEEFPFNRGMLCPKGVKRYLQDSHPDRLLTPLMRTEAGFRQAAWDEALDFTAKRLREIQQQYGKDAVAVYGGASLATEKSYLLGKFARVATAEVGGCVGVELFGQRADAAGGGDGEAALEGEADAAIGDLLDGVGEPRPCRGVLDTVEFVDHAYKLATVQPRGQGGNVAWLQRAGG